MKSSARSLKSWLLFGASALIAGAMAPPVRAQEPPQADAEASEDEIVVVGTQIRGAQVTDVLPVTVLGEDDIDAIAPASGDELFRAIPQAGDVTFNEARLAGGINDARGDTASINLRGIGTGNTLMLLNGRRMVLHPAIQVENFVPVATVNANAIPTAGVRRVEVLRDGASAIYGTDAVAGVINTVLRDNFEGLRIEFEGARAADSEMDQLDLSIEAGVDLNGGRTNISFFGNFTDRDPLFAADREFSRDADMRHLFGASDPYRDFFRNTSTITPWAEFQRLSPTTLNPVTTAIQQFGTSVTSSGIFHVQPDTNDGCIVPMPGGVCFDNSSLSTLTADENLRYNDNEPRTLWGGVDRANAFLFINHEFDNDIEFFAELGGYHSDLTSFREQESSLATQRLIIPADNYWNPFGPVGSANRLPGLTSGTSGAAFPSAGVPLQLIDYRVVDAGPLRINVDQHVLRGLAGFRGTWNEWDWETAALYSEAGTNDTMRLPSMTLFQDALNVTTPDAYNPFNGGDPNNPSEGDSSPNPQDLIDSFMVDVTRESATSMAMVDFRVSRPDLFPRLFRGSCGRFERLIAV